MAHGRSDRTGLTSRPDAREGVAGRGSPMRQHPRALSPQHTRAASPQSTRRASANTLRLPSAPRQERRPSVDSAGRCSVASKKEQHQRLYQKLYGGSQRCIPQDVLNQLSQDVDLLLDMNYIPPSKPGRSSPSKPDRSMQVTITSPGADASKLVNLPAAPDEIIAPVECGTDSAHATPGTPLERRANHRLSSEYGKLPDSLSASGNRNSKHLPPSRQLERSVTKTLHTFLLPDPDSPLKSQQSTQPHGRSPFGSTYFSAGNEGPVLDKSATLFSQAGDIYKKDAASVEKSRVTLLENLQKLEELSRAKHKQIALASAAYADNASEQTTSTKSSEGSGHVGVEVALWRLRRYLWRRFGTRQQAWEAIEAASVSFSGIMGGKPLPRMAGTLHNREIMSAFSRLGIKLPWVCGYGSVKELISAIDNDDSGFTTSEELLGPPDCEIWTQGPPREVDDPLDSARREWTMTKGLPGGVFDKFLGQVVTRDLHEPMEKPRPASCSGRNFEPFWKTSSQEWVDKLKMREEQEAAAQEKELEDCTFEPNADRRFRQKFDRYGLKISSRSKSPNSIRKKRWLKDLYSHAVTENSRTFTPKVEEKSTLISHILSKSGNSVSQRLSDVRHRDRLGHVDDILAEQAELLTLHPDIDSEYGIHHDRSGPVYDRLYHHHHHMFWRNRDCLENRSARDGPSTKSSPRMERSSRSTPAFDRYSQSTPALSTVADQVESDPEHVIPLRRAVLTTMATVEQFAMKVDSNMEWALKGCAGRFPAWGESATARRSAALPDPPSVLVGEEDEDDFQDGHAPRRSWSRESRRPSHSESRLSPADSESRPQSSRMPSSRRREARAAESPQSARLDSRAAKKKHRSPSAEKAWKMPVHQWVRTNSMEQVA